MVLNPYTAEHDVDKAVRVQVNISLANQTPFRAASIAFSILRVPHTESDRRCAERGLACETRLISGSSDLTWEGASESNSWRRVESEGQRKMKWAESSGAVRRVVSLARLSREGECSERQDFR